MAYVAWPWPLCLPEGGSRWVETGRGVIEARSPDGAPVDFAAIEIATISAALNSRLAPGVASSTSMAVFPSQDVIQWYSF